LGGRVGVQGRETAGSPLMARLVRARTARFAELLRRSGKVGNPGVMASASVRNSFRCAFVAAPTAFTLALAVSPWFLAVGAVPLVFFFAPELSLRDLVARRREGVDGELPFFAAVVSVLGSVGVPLYSMFKDLAGSELFEHIGSEALLVKRDVEIFGMNANEAFERLASSHPSKKFSEFLLGYTSKVRSGGDVPYYLVSESGALLKDLEEGWSRYVARIGIVGSMMITVFGVVPLLLMVVGIFSPGMSIVGLAIFTGLGVPLFTVGLLRMTGRMQPMREEPIQGRAAVAMALALPGVLVGLLTRVAWAGAATALFIFFVFYGLSVKEQLAETKAMDLGLSGFLKDLLEYRRQEYDLTRAVVAIEAGRGYNRHFHKFLSRVAAQLKAGVPLDEVKVESRGKLGKLAFLLLGQMSRSGGGTVDTVYQLSSFADRLTGMRQSAAAEMKPYLILSYISPVLLAFGVAFVEGVLSSFGSRVAPGFATLHVSGVQLGTIPPGLSQVSDLLIVVSAASLGLIGAKITDLTVRNTLRASVNVALAVAAIALMAMFISHSPVQGP
jgi:archaeal flagellar protein FlaJ